MEELASLPAGSAPAADVLGVPVNNRITQAAPRPAAPPLQRAAQLAVVAVAAVAVVAVAVAARPNWWAWFRCPARANQRFSRSVAAPAGAFAQPAVTPL